MGQAIAVRTDFTAGEVFSACQGGEGRRAGAAAFVNCGGARWSIA